mgnify:CR=1 FL=1
MLQNEEKTFSSVVKKEKWLEFDHIDCRTKEREVNYAKDKVKNEYMLLIHGKENMPRRPDGKPRRADPRDFLGPSSDSLETKNIMPIDIDSSVPNLVPLGIVATTGKWDFSVINIECLGDL